MSYPKTDDEWWEMVQVHRVRITDIMARVGLTLDERTEFLRLVGERTNWERVYNLMQKAWVQAPDTPAIHGWPSWGNLCDLCSEGPGIFEEEGVSP